MNYRKITSYISIAFLSFFSYAIPASAQAPASERSYQTLTNIDGLTSDISTSGAVNLGDFLTNAFSFLVAMAVVAAIVMITVGGFQYLTSAASGSKESAKSKIQNSIKGLLLILLTYIILYTINPATVSLDFLTGVNRVDLNSSIETIGYRYEYIDMSGLYANATRERSALYDDWDLCDAHREVDLLDEVFTYQETAPSCEEGTFGTDAKTYNYSFTTRDEPELALLTPRREIDTRDLDFTTINYSDPGLCDDSLKNLKEEKNSIRPYSVVVPCFLEDPDTGPTLVGLARDILENNTTNPHIDYIVSDSEGDVTYRNFYSFILGYTDTNGVVQNYRTRPYTSILQCQNVVRSVRDRVHSTYYENISRQCVEDNYTGGGKSYTTQIIHSGTGREEKVVFPVENDCNVYQADKLTETRNKYRMLGTCQKVSN